MQDSPATLPDDDSGSRFDPDTVQRFHYTGHDFDPAAGTLRCTYALDDLAFVEQIRFAPVGPQTVDIDAVRAAARLVYLLAGVSYYKAAAPPVIDLGDDALTPAERALLEAHYADGLGEYGFVNDLDVTNIQIVAPTRAAMPQLDLQPPRRPLIPFGGGIDSIVTVEAIRQATPDAALFVVSRDDDRFEAIETAAKVTGLPVVRAERRLDDKILQSRALGYRNGHVPVTAVISAMAVTAALIDGRDAVVMSNEHSASDATMTVDGRDINHQWSKSLAFEDLLRAALAESVTAGVDYYSWLRPRSELWVAERLAAMEPYLLAFRSCNRSFHINPAQRLDHWCGECDKCCFVDLILSPFLSPEDLAQVFDGNEPLMNPDLADKFRALLDTSGDAKPFECVGDVDECRVAGALAAQRPDRAQTPMLHELVAEVARLHPIDPTSARARLMQPLGPHRIPDVHAPADLLG